MGKKSKNSYSLHLGEDETVADILHFSGITDSATKTGKRLTTTTIKVL